MNVKENWGMRFREHMGGFFAERTDDPTIGYNRGRMDNTRVDFWVGIEIESLKRFIEEPSYCAAMNGVVSVSNIARKTPLKNGEFNIYPGPAGSGFRHITYRFGFESSSGEPFYFSGIKNIHEDSKLRTGSEAITLYSKIHRGDSEAGEVCGAGILLFSIMKDGPSFFVSFRTPGARSIKDRIAAMMALQKLTNP